MVWHRTIIYALSLVVIGCEESPTPTPRSWNLLNETHHPFWSAAKIEQQGAFSITSSLIRLEPGSPMTGAVYSAWDRAGLPRNNYEVVYEARRIEGTDFFAALTFPVEDTWLTFVPGGWSGATTGLSNIDGQSAIDNQTGSAQRYDQGAWYRFRLEIKSEHIKVWMDDRLIVNLSPAGRSLELRAGDIERCKPFGIASFGTAGEVRLVQVTALSE